MTPEEANLLAKMRAGDPQALRRLYELYADRVSGFALRLTGNRSETEDIVQEVLVAAYAGHAACQGRARPLTWLLGIATRRWRDRRRQRSTLPQEGDALDHLAFSGAQRSLESEVIDALTLDCALQQLDPPFRQALLLVASQGLTYREAADVMAEPVGTVKWRVSRATREMSRLLRAVEVECNEMPQRATTGSRSGCR